MHARRTLISFIGLGSHTAAPLLYSYIVEHPSVSLPKAPTHFFSKAKSFALGVGWYEGNFAHDEGMVCGELAYDYLPSSQSVGLISRTYPNAHLLAVIENPLVSIRVEYIEALRQGRIKRSVTLAEFLKQNPEVLLRARYGRQLVHYFSYYSPNDFLVFLASDIRHDPLKAVALAFAHIGVDKTYIPTALRHLIVEEVDEKKRPGFIKRGFTFIKGLIKKGYLKLYLFLKPPKALVATANELALRVPIPPELEVKLKGYFRPDVAELSTLLHRNLLIEWGFVEETKK